MGNRTRTVLLSVSLFILGPMALAVETSKAPVLDPEHQLIENCKKSFGSKPNADTVCACVARNHRIGKTPLLAIAEVYKPKRKQNPKLIKEALPYMEYDMEIAEECVNDPGYVVPPPEAE